MKKIYSILIGLVALIGLIGLTTWWFSGSNSGSSTVGKTKGTATEVAYFDERAKVQYFYSDTCSWCQKEALVLKELSRDGYRIKPMDVQANPNLWDEFKIDGTPTFIAPDGDRRVGYQTKEQLQPWLDKYK